MPLNPIEFPPKKCLEVLPGHIALKSLGILYLKECKYDINLKGWQEVVEIAALSDIHH